MRVMVPIKSLVLVVTLLEACGGSQPVPTTTHAGDEPSHARASQRPLRVALFPYIPPFDDMEHRALADHLAREFTQESGLPVTIDFIDTYGMDESSEHLGSGDAAYDLVEIDLVGLPALATRVGTWDLPADDVAPAALSAATIDGTVAAWPTYVCGFFVYSREPELRSATSLAQLVTWLGDVGQPLVGDSNGSSTLPAIYVDAYVDSHQTFPAGDASSVDVNVRDGLRSLLRRCGSLDRANPCLNDSYDLYDGNLGGIQRFVQADARALLGYSEFLYYVIRESRDPVDLSGITVVSAPLGAASHPVLFTDGLVRNANCAGECAERARRFAEFLTSVPTQSAIAFGEDATPPVPRYLLMARREFWASDRVSRDPVYAQLRDSVMSSESQPFRSTLLSRDDILEAVVPSERGTR